METLRLRVNGTWHQFVRGTQIPDEMTLAELLRNVLGYTDVRLVCNEGACGACTVLVNGRSVLSCMTLAAGQIIKHPFQQALVLETEVFLFG